MRDQEVATAVQRVEEQNQALTERFGQSRPALAGLAHGLAHELAVAGR